MLGAGLRPRSAWAHSAQVFLFCGRLCLSRRLPHGAFISDFSFSQWGSLMNNLTKRLEQLANVAVIVVALLLGGVLVKRYLLPQAESTQAQARIQPGTKLSVPGVEWGKNERTLLLVLSTSCHFCTESSPFYQRLAQERAKKGGVGLVLLLPQSVGESQKYLNDLGVSVDDIRQAGLDAVQA